ncbi:hypothetical protein HG531_001962 [Fusarium graminearum]|nr:hypothetical protein HG531_001962 [Fusarium graminearum]
MPKIQIKSTTRSRSKMCVLIEMIVDFFKKKKKAGSAHEALELGQISHPYDVRRVDSKGNPIDSQDRPIPNNLPVTDPVVTTCFASTRGGRSNLDAVAIFRGLPIPDGSAVTDGTSTTESTPPAIDGPTVDPKVEAGAHGKQDTDPVVSGPAPKDI